MYSLGSKLRSKAEEHGKGGGHPHDPDKAVRRVLYAIADIIDEWLYWLPSEC